MNNEITLAKLIGSPKQIAWAEKIRENAIARMGTCDTTGCTPGNWNWIPDNERRTLAACIRSASWWIENRDESMTLELLQAAVAENEAITAKEAERKRNAREWEQYQEDVRWGKIKGYNYLSEKFGY